MVRNHRYQQHSKCEVLLGREKPPQYEAMWKCENQVLLLHPRAGLGESWCTHCRGMDAKQPSNLHLKLYLLHSNPNFHSYINKMLVILKLFLDRETPPQYEAMWKCETKCYCRILGLDLVSHGVLTAVEWMQSTPAIYYSMTPFTSEYKILFVYQQ